MAKRNHCPKCQRPQNQCLCHTIEQVPLENRLIILQDQKESIHPFNTARLAKLVSPEIELVTSENINEELIQEIKLLRPFLLFKNEGSIALKSENIHLLESNNFIVLDGTWKKARKIYHTWPQLSELPCFHLELSDQKTIYQSIRKSCGETHLSTLEAITETLFMLGEIQENQRNQLLAPLKELIKQQEAFQHKPN
ncbi:DTW domain protein [Bacteriovorax sp. BAL6_X]|uniref:tRNA-uridine aminocarboxypropyltransferase n=1 Tax=Bacteriovorax sp. BAL6_X TaxID=1201290 RepID=UPI0003857761|nr:tRNA-uridine aminocarboxypropyltransferase [Bacteriovorax sp. BAL6_X]EPZ51157.1 DTW domain protein [Bacteriovorax sp. BAL6_X]